MNTLSRSISRLAAAAQACAVAALLNACGVSGPDQTDEPTLARASGGSLSPLPLPTPTPLPSPRIWGEPTDATVGNGAGVVFGVGATGFAPITYQWFKDGAAIPGATSTQLILATTSAADAGRYRVRVRDGAGSTVMSAEARLNVVSGTWARLGGRPIYPAPLMKQPALALCAQPTVAHLMRSGERVTLYAHYFDGAAWRPFGKGGILNATKDGDASDPSIDCVSDGATSRPVVAWSEGTGAARGIYVKVFDGADWVPIGNVPLNVNAGSTASKPVVRVTPLDASTGNTLQQGLTLRSAVAWIEDGVPSLRQWTRSGWQALPGGVQIPGGSRARDLAMTIELDDQARTYPPVVAWLEESNGAYQVFAATHSQGFASWISMGAPLRGPRGLLPAAQLQGRIGIGVGKYLNGRQPLAVWASGSESASFQSHMYPTAHFVNGNANQDWALYADPFAPGGRLISTSFDAREFRLQGNNACAFGDVLAFGLAIAHDGGFEVRRGKCNPGFGAPVLWELVRPVQATVLSEIALRMAGDEDPVVAGTQLAGTQYELSIWRYYP